MKKKGKYINTNNNLKISEDKYQYFIYLQSLYNIYI